MGGTVCKLIFSKWQIYFCIIIIKESDFFKQKKQDLWKTGIYSNIFRFLDDLCTFNIMMNLEIITRYLPWWAGTQEGKWIFLWNLMFWIFNRNYQSHALFDNNIPSKIFYAPIGFEIPHIARKTTDMVNMVTRVDLLTIRIKAR